MYIISQQTGDFNARGCAKRKSHKSAPWTTLDAYFSPSGYFHQIFTNAGPKMGISHSTCSSSFFISITQNMSLLSPERMGCQKWSRERSCDANLRLLIHNIDSKRLQHHKKSQKRVLTHSICYKRNLHFFDNFLGCHRCLVNFSQQANRTINHMFFTK